MIGKFFENTSRLVVLIITSIILGLMVYLNFNDVHKTKVTQSEKIYVIVYFIVCILIGFLLYKIKSKKYFIIGLFAVSFIIRLIWVLNINSVPVSDFTQMYEGAQNILNGNTELVRNSSYFEVWVYQLGFSAFQSIILRIFGDSILVLKITNAFISACIPVVIYLICDKLKNNKYSRIPALIYAFYLTSIAMTSVLTNQHLATLLIYIGLYILIDKDNNILWLAVSGVLIALGNIIRPEGIIVIIALFLFFIFKDFSNIKKPKIFLTKNVLRPVLILLVYLITITSVSAVFKAKGYTDYNIGNREPYWKFVVGLNPKHAGLWNSEDGELVNRYPVGNERDEYEKKLILERIKDKDAMLELFDKKFKYMWSGNDWGSIGFSLNYENVSDGFRNILLRIEKIEFMAIITLMSLSLIFTIFRRVPFNNYYLFMIIFIGYVLVHLIVEVQTRYRYFIIPCMVILTVEALSQLKILDNYKEKIPKRT